MTMRGGGKEGSWNPPASQSCLVSNLQVQCRDIKNEIGSNWGRHLTFLTCGLHTGTYMHTHTCSQYTLHTYIYTCTLYTHTYAYMPLHIHKHTHKHTYTGSHTHMTTHIYIHSCAHECRNTCTHLHTKLRTFLSFHQWKPVCLC